MSKERKKVVYQMDQEEAGYVANCLSYLVEKKRKGGTPENAYDDVNEVLLDIGGGCQDKETKEMIMVPSWLVQLTADVLAANRSEDLEDE